MEFTALHRHLGRQPGPLTDEMLDEAANQGIAEAGDLDWKDALPPAKGLPQTDFPKDIAAMANSGGGVIVYGMAEEQKAATKRLDVGALNETHERALRSAVVTAISPPIFGLGIHQLVGNAGKHAVVLVVPNSLDGPHLIYKNDYFGAPVRNDADTVWMKEREIEAMYRARFEESRNAHEALNALYDDAVAGRDINQRAWLIGVARPRIPSPVRVRLSQADARGIFGDGASLALVFAGRGGTHPLESVDMTNLRPGLRRWTAPNIATSERANWKESWASIHNDGSVTIVTAIGGHRIAHDEHHPGNTVITREIECAVADLMAMLRATSDHVGAQDYEVRVGIEYTGHGFLEFRAANSWADTYPSLARYIPITVSVRTDVDAEAFMSGVYDLVTDAVNQAGVTEPALTQSPPQPRDG